MFKQFKKYVLSLSLIIAFSFSQAWSLPSDWPQNGIIVLPDMKRNPFIALINDAKHTLDLSAYKISDPQMVEALIEAAKRGVKVRALVQPSAFTHEKSDNIKSPVERLKASGIHIFQLSERYNQAHHKFFMVDGKYAVISTGNLDAESFDGILDKTEPAARDFAITLEDTELLAQLNAVFEKDILCQTTVLTSAWSKDHNDFLVWGPETQRHDLLAMINGATQSIYIYQQDFTDEGIAKAVADAAKRGVKVKIIMMPFPFSKEEDKNKPNQDLLRKAGAEVHLVKDYYIHAKVMVVDATNPDKRMMYLGSCNFYQNSLDYNRELGLATHSADKINAVRDVFKKDWWAR